MPSRLSPTTSAIIGLAIGVPTPAPLTTMRARGHSRRLVNHPKLRVMNLENRRNMGTVKRSVAAHKAHRDRTKKALDRVTAEPLRTWLQDKIDWYTAAIEALHAGRALPPKPQPPTRKPTFCVYRHFDAHGALLYIGETDDWQGRTKDHRHTAPWFGEVVTIKIEHFATRRAKAEAEKRAVRQEEPLWNILLQLPQLPLETLMSSEQHGPDKCRASGSLQERRKC